MSAAESSGSRGRGPDGRPGAHPGEGVFASVNESLVRVADEISASVPRIERYGGYTVNAEWPEAAIPDGFDVVVDADAQELDPGWHSDPGVIRLD